jgi:hypothetical protein
MGIRIGELMVDADKQKTVRLRRLCVFALKSAASGVPLVEKAKRKIQGQNQHEGDNRDDRFHDGP